MRMLNFSFNGRSYRAPVLSAFDQFDCLRAIEPVMQTFRDSRSGRPKAPPNHLALLTTALSALDGVAIERLCDLCLAGVEREEIEAEWLPVWDVEASDALFDDLGAASVLSLVGRVIMENLRSYIVRPVLNYMPADHTPMNFSSVSLPEGRSWLLRPVEAGMCRFESLLNGTLDLGHIALMNDALTVKAENESRARKAARETQS